MRAFIISSAVFILSLGLWTWSHMFFGQVLDEYSSFITTDIVPAVSEGRWEDALFLYGGFEDDWEENRRYMNLFYDRDRVNAVDDCIKRSKEFMSAEDPSNSAGELSSLANQLQYLRYQEYALLYRPHLS